MLAAALAEVLRDVRHGLRGMRRSPGFTAISVLVVGLGIAVNTAMFSVVDAVLLRPLELPRAEQLAVVWKGPKGGRGVSGIGPAEAIELPRMLRSGSAAAAFTLTSAVFVRGDEAERLLAMRTTDDFFRTLGVTPYLGRDFSSGDDVFGASPVAIISHALWRRRFNADPAAVGGSMLLNDEPHLVIGVLPEGVRFPEAFGLTLQPEVWTTLRYPPQEAATRGAGYVFVLLRRSDNGSWARVQGDLDAATAVFAQTEPQGYTDQHLMAVPLKEQVVRDVRTSLLIVWGAVVAVLLIACANIANLLLSRTAARSQELAVRASLGASRPRLVRQMLTESVLLALAGATAGLLLALFAVRMLRPELARVLPRASEVGLDGRVLGFTMLAAVVTGILFGSVPAWQLARAAPSATLRLASRGHTGGRSTARLRAVLGACQIAVALFLVTGAGLLIRSFEAVQRVDLGFEPSRLLTLELSLPARRYDSERAVAFFEDVTARIEALPEVESAAAISNLPLSGSNFSWSFLVRDRPLGPTTSLPSAEVRIVSPAAFRTLAIPIRSGRAFTPADGPRSQPVAIVNETVARTYWPAEDPIGKEIKLAGSLTVLPWMTVVGVVADVRLGAPDLEARPAIYRPHTQHQWRDMSVVARTRGDPLAATADVRAAIRAADPTVAMLNVRSFDDYLSGSVARRRLLMWLLTGFSAIALGLALVGIYGLLSYAVTLRRREIGVRLALGAHRARVLWLVLREAIGLAAIGLVTGSVAALLAARAMRSMLYGVGPTDPATFIGVALVVFITVVLASCIPASRAAAVDPAVTLKSE